MRFALVYSNTNEAGKNIVNEFKKLVFAPQIPIIEVKKKHVIFEEELNPKKYPELRGIDFLVIASTHRSAAGNPSLSVHAPGNFRNADLGGTAGKVCPTSAFVLKFLFQKIEELSLNDDYIKNKFERTLEVTHHGPLTTIPCIFIELGSSEKEWKDVQGAKLLAKAIMSLMDFEPKDVKDKWIPCIAIGGPHYCPNYNKIQLNSKYAISHVIPSYVMPLTPSMLSQAEEKTIEHIDEVIIDWKSFNSKTREIALDIIEKSGLKYKKTKEIEK